MWAAQAGRRQNVWNSWAFDWQVFQFQGYSPGSFDETAVDELGEVVDDNRPEGHRGKKRDEDDMDDAEVAAGEFVLLLVVGVWIDDNYDNRQKEQNNNNNDSNNNYNDSNDKNKKVCLFLGHLPLSQRAWTHCIFTLHNTFLNMLLVTKYLLISLTPTHPHPPTHTHTVPTHTTMYSYME